MRRLFYIFFLTFICKGLFAQDRDTTWKDLQGIESPYYLLLIPSGWQDFGPTSEFIEHSIDASGLYYAKDFNSAPIIVGLFILKQPGSNLEDVRESCLHGYRTNLDRVFPDNFIEGQKKVKLRSGQDAYILNTHFYRNSKNLNQTRFDLVVYSDKAQNGYLITISIQYNDPTYSFENEFHLVNFARKIYDNFILK